MKKVNLKAVAVLLASSFLYSSCIGSFSLFNKYAKWQCNMTGSKFVNAIVGFILMPIVGSITLFVDAVVLNTIEFWSGSNPVTANIGKTQKVIGEDGLEYAVKTLKDGYQVTAPDGTVTLFSHNAADDSWQMTVGGETHKLFRFAKDGKSIIATVNGQEQAFTLDQNGIEAAKQAASMGVFYAAR